jgi:hypothetical protein
MAYETEQSRGSRPMGNEVGVHVPLETITSGGSRPTLIGKLYWGFMSHAIWSI